MNSVQPLFVKAARVICPTILAAIAGLIIYDACLPWDKALRALERDGSHVRLCVGVGYESLSSTEGGTVTFTSLTTRSFALISFRDLPPRVVTVSEDHEGHVEVDESVAIFWAWLVTILGSSWGTWHFWIRRKRLPESPPRIR